LRFQALPAFGHQDMTAARQLRGKTVVTVIPKAPGIAALGFLAGNHFLPKNFSLLLDTDTPLLLLGLDPVAVGQTRLRVVLRLPAVAVLADRLVHGLGDSGLVFGPEVDHALLVLLPLVHALRPEAHPVTLALLQRIGPDRSLGLRSMEPVALGDVDRVTELTGPTDLAEFDPHTIGTVPGDIAEGADLNHFGQTDARSIRGQIIEGHLLP